MKKHSLQNQPLSLPSPHPHPKGPAYTQRWLTSPSVIPPVLLKMCKCFLRLSPGVTDVWEFPIKCHFPVGALSFFGFLGAFSDLFSDMSDIQEFRGLINVGKTPRLGFMAFWNLYFVQMKDAKVLCLRLNNTHGYLWLRGDQSIVQNDSRMKASFPQTF